jgi:hypothetical protein
MSPARFVVTVESGFQLRVVIMHPSPDRSSKQAAYQRELEVISPLWGAYRARRCWARLVPWPERRIWWPPVVLGRHLLPPRILRFQMAKSGNGRINGSVVEIPWCLAALPRRQKASARRYPRLAARTFQRTRTLDKLRSTSHDAVSGTIPQQAMDSTRFRCTRTRRSCPACRIAAFFTFRRKNNPSPGK